MKRFGLGFWLLAFVLASAIPSSAQARKRAAPRPAPVATNAAADPGVWMWRYYGVDPLVPANMIPQPGGPNMPVMDDVQISNIILRAAGYERANDQIREGMGLVLFSDPTVFSYRPGQEHPFWAEFERQIRAGEYVWKVFEDGHRFDYKMASGAHQANGTVKSHLSHAPAQNATGHTVRAIAPKTPIPYKGSGVLPLIFEFCRNIDAENAAMPIQPVPTAAIPPAPIASAMAVAINELPPAPPPQKEKEHHHFSCGPLKGVYCWGPAVAAGTWLLLYESDRHHGQTISTVPESVKVPTPLPPRP